MAIRALLLIDGGKTFNEDTTFEVRPEIGEQINFWKDGREPTAAIVRELRHHQSENGFFLVIEATSEVVDPAAMIA